MHSSHLDRVDMTTAGEVEGKPCEQCGGEGWKRLTLRRVMVDAVAGDKIASASRWAKCRACTSTGKRAA